MSGRRTPILWGADDLHLQLNSELLGGSSQPGPLGLLRLSDGHASIGAGLGGPLRSGPPPLVGSLTLGQTHQGPAPNPKPITYEQLHAIMPRLKHKKLTAYLAPLNAAMTEAQITTPLRQAAFLAQIAHESIELRYFEEIASGEAYEGRKRLGNTEPGDGPRFKGRGPIQLTGRANYRKAGKALGLDLENNPEIVATPAVGFRVAGWFWTSRHLNKKADIGNFDGITKRVNGGFRGKASRDRYYGIAKRVLGVPES